MNELPMVQAHNQKQAIIDDLCIEIRNHICEAEFVKLLNQHKTIKTQDII
jgi:hypothetical protein